LFTSTGRELALSIAVAVKHHRQIVLGAALCYYLFPPQLLLTRFVVAGRSNPPLSRSKNYEFRGSSSLLLSRHHGVLAVELVLAGKMKKLAHAFKSGHKGKRPDEDSQNGQSFFPRASTFVGSVRLQFQKQESARGSSFPKSL
jgi:hypothetical protein